MHRTATNSRVVSLLALCLLTPALGAAPAQAADSPASHSASALPDATPTAAGLSAALDLAGTRVAPTVPAAGALTHAPTDPAAGVSFGADKLSVGVPDAGSASRGVVVDGVTVYRNTTNQDAIAVNPTKEGGQLLVNVGSASSPTSYRFPFKAPSGAKVQLTKDGGARVVLGDGSLAASIPAPWAQDAAGKPVATRFRVEGNSLIQEISHRAAGTTYPVLADPRIYRCDGWTSTCVLLSKKETKRVARLAAEGKALEVFITGLCAIAGGPVGVAACAATVVLVADKLRKTFRRAAKKGKCVELHFFGVGGALWKWQVKSCS